MCQWLPPATTPNQVLLLPLHVLSWVSKGWLNCAYLQAITGRTQFLDADNTISLKPFSAF